MIVSCRKEQGREPIVSCSAAPGLGQGESCRSCSMREVVFAASRTWSLEDADKASDGGQERQMKSSVCFFSSFFFPQLSPAQPCKKKSLWASVLCFCLPQGPINMQGPLPG